MVDCIRPLWLEGSSPTPPLAIFFVTPSLASWLQPDQPFVRLALRQAFGNYLAADAPFGSVRSLVAVVDKLPVSPPMLHIAQANMAARPSRAGAEGVAYALYPSAGAVEQRRQHLLPSNADSAIDGKIRFFVPRHRHISQRFLDFVELPLANTLFHNGCPVTLISSHWTKLSGTEELLCRSTDWLKYQSLKWLAPGTCTSNTELEVIDRREAPLVPLTLPRAVLASMGNIVRQVKDPESGTAIPASEELEVAIQRFLATHARESTPIPIWALVLPGKEAAGFVNKSLATSPIILNEIPFELWRAGSTYNRTQAALWPSLSRGARLHRVVGGGGGWGTQAGLLSLDPTDSSWVPAQNASCPPSPNMHPDNDLMIMKQFILDGEFIQFYTAPLDNPKPEDLQHQYVGDPWQLAHNLSSFLELGTLSAASVPCTASSSQPAAVPSHRCQELLHCFGGLSEKGLFTMQKRFNPSVFRPGDAQGFKVDVPGSRIQLKHLRFYCTQKSSRKVPPVDLIATEPRGIPSMHQFDEEKRRDQPAADLDAVKLSGTLPSFHIEATRFRWLKDNSNKSPEAVSTDAAAVTMSPKALCGKNADAQAHRHSLRYLERFRGSFQPKKQFHERSVGRRWYHAKGKAIRPDPVPRTTVATRTALKTSGKTTELRQRRRRKDVTKVERRLGEPLHLEGRGASALRRPSSVEEPPSHRRSASSAMAVNGKSPRYRNTYDSRLQKMSSKSMSQPRALGHSLLRSESHSRPALRNSRDIIMDLAAQRPSMDSLLILSHPQPSASEMQRGDGDLESSIPTQRQPRKSVLHELKARAMRRLKEQFVHFF